MAVLDTSEANRLLEAIVGKTTYPATTGPVKMRLNTAVGSDSAAGTEVTGGSYAALPITSWNAAASRAITNVTAPSYTGMPACTVTSVDFYDQAGTPVRKVYGNLGGSKVVAAGDTLSFAAGAISIAFS
jgi:hypothetical protein